MPKVGRLETITIGQLQNNTFIGKVKLLSGPKIIIIPILEDLLPNNGINKSVYQGLIMLSFENIQKKYGDVVAYSILMDIERHLKLSSTTLADVDPAERFRRALALMDHNPS